MSNLLRRAGCPRRRRGWALRPYRTIAYFTALLIGTLLAAQTVQAAPVPNFTLTLLAGKSITLKDFRGKPVLINFFHSK